MKDQADKQTQPLPLEQPKRGRGRPATGAAMTPAEKQKAYRERQKAAAGNVTVNNVDEVQRLLKEVGVLSEENRRLRAELKSQKSIEKSAHGDEIWTPRFKTKGSRNWVNCDEQVDFEGVAWTFEDTARHVREMEKMHKGSAHWQAVRDDGLIYDPRAAK